MHLCVGNAYKVAKNGVDFIRMLWYNDFIEDEIVDMNSCEFSICASHSICTGVLDMLLTQREFIAYRV